ncbi:MULTISPECIES: three component ABC system middle component [unclassified Pseudomonas]|uniref:three component ABC system middle component n=1 Tax=unclassified Pseudomonas TaxID=196821 RepID=UPI001CBE666D|nr:MULTISPECIES: three component ABC system middle component [unclassified Pseudomonas]
MGATDHIFTLHRTPFALAPLLHAFYDEAEEKEKGILLSYLILPLLLYPPMQKFLKGANKRSTLRTLCNDHRRLIGLDARVQDFKSLTNAALLILLAEKGVEVGEDMSLTSIGKICSGNAHADLLKMSKKLAAIFADIEVVSIYRTLGLKSL